MFKEAELGRKYRKELEDGVVRLCMALELGAEYEVVRSVMKTAAAEDLMKLRSALEERLACVMPVTTQLKGKHVCDAGVEAGYLI